MQTRKKFMLSDYLVTDRDFYKRALAIVIPVMLQYLINTGVNMLDTIMVGKLGEISISASTLANQFCSIFQFLCMGLSAAGLVLTAQYWGAGDRGAVYHVFDLLIQLILIVGTLFGIVSFLFPEEILSIYTNDADVIKEGADYLRITAFIYLPNGLALVISNVIRCVGNAKLGLYISIVSFVVNLFCNYIFIFGKLGLPAMGVKGAAIGTLCARLVEFTVCAVYMLKIDKQLAYRPKGVLKLPSKKLLNEFVRLGLPAIISDTLLALASSAISIILGHMGREIVSAFSIVTVVDRLCTVACSGMSSASGVMIGQAVGEGAFERARKESWSFVIISAGVGVIAGILVLLFGNLSIGFYEITAETAEITRLMMSAMAIIAFFQSIQSTLSKGVLRGGGDTRFLMVADVIFQWVASIPLGYLAGIVLGWSPFWVLITLRIDFVIKSVWLLFRLKGDKWIHQAKKVS